MDEFNVSIATIMSAMNLLAQEGLVSRYRGRGTFVTNPALSVKNSENQWISKITLGLFLPNQMNLTTDTMSLATGTMKGIYERAHETATKLEFILHHNETEKQLRCQEVLEGKIKVDGCLVLYLQDYENVVSTLQKASFPYVVIETPCVYDEGINQILQDNKRAAELAVKHLIEHGHERIAYLGPADVEKGGRVNPWFRSRLEGYQSALKNAGLTVEPSLIEVKLPGRTYEDGCQGIRALLQRAEFSALLTGEGILSISAIDVLRAEGKRVPLDVAITSFNAEEYPKMADEKYSVSGICTSRVLMGHAGVDALSRMVHGDITLDSPYLEETPMTFLTRRSCGCLPPVS